MPRFRQLDYIERQCIAVLWMQHYTMAKIARLLGRARSTIKRELERNGRYDQEGKLLYHPEDATLKYYNRQRKAGYGKGYRRYFGSNDPGGLLWLNGLPNPLTVEKWKGYRYRPELLYAFKDRRSTKQADRLRFDRESINKRRPKNYTYIYKESDEWPLPYWLQAKRAPKQTYPDLFAWMKQRGPEPTRKNRLWKSWWSNRRRKEAHRPYRRKRFQPYGWLVSPDTSLKQPGHIPEPTPTQINTFFSNLKFVQTYVVALLCLDVWCNGYFFKNEPPLWAGSLFHS